MKPTEILQDLKRWLADIYRQYGWQAALIALVVIVGLLAGLTWLFQLPIAAWMGL